MSGRSISVTPGGGAPTFNSPELLHNSCPFGFIHLRPTECVPTSSDPPLRCTTRCARGWTAGSVATWSASNTPSTLSFPSCERLAASAKSANETCMGGNIDGADMRRVRFAAMTELPGSDAPPGREEHQSRPGVWLTDLSLLAMALIWAVNFSVVKFATGLLHPLAFNAVRVSFAAVT